MTERIKEICDFVSRGSTPIYVDESGYKVMNQATFSKGYIDTDRIRYTSYADISSNIHKGDLLIASTGGGVLGKLLYYDSDDNDFYADTHVTILRNTMGRNLMKFLYYYFLVRYDEINSTLVKGSTNQTELQRNYLLSYELDIPDLNLQHLIVKYLDSKTEEIDQKIELLNKQREAYERLKKATINHVVTRGLDPNVPMRDSKVDFIGLIPENWLVQRLKDLGYLYGGLSGKSGEDFQCDDESKTKPFIQFTNILNNFYISPHQTARVIMSDGEEQNTVNKGDLLFLMSSEDYESIGKSAVMKNNLGEIYLNSFCRGLRLTSKNIYPIYLNFLLNSDKMRDDVRIEAKGFTRINLKVNKISELKVTVPPIDEQISIVAFLENKLAKIDKLIENINKRIDAYKRLKRSLINEVVTGKRKI